MLNSFKAFIVPQNSAISFKIVSNRSLLFSFDRHIHFVMYEFKNFLSNYSMIFCCPI